MEIFTAQRYLEKCLEETEKLYPYIEIENINGNLYFLHDPSKRFFMAVGIIFQRNMETTFYMKKYKDKRHIWTKRCKKDVVFQKIKSFVRESMTCAEIQKKSHKIYSLYHLSFFHLSTQDVESWRKIF